MNMYKYQQETINAIIETAENMENVTDEQKTIKIGFIRDKRWIDGWNGGWKTYTGDLYVAINKTYRFYVKDEFDNFFFEKMDIIDEDAYISIEQNIFLKLNKWIDNIYKNERQRKAFHEELNLQLNALNKSLELNNSREAIRDTLNL